MVQVLPANVKEVEALVGQGEGLTLEWKRSSGEVREAMQTVVAFLNGKGGTVLFGVRPDGRIEGQQVADQTLRDFAEAFDRIEPPFTTEIRRIVVAKDREVILLCIEAGAQSIPFTCDGRPYQRVGSTTRRMAQEKYETLLLHRMHSRRRWENQPADEISFKDIDRDEVFRILSFARSVGRLQGPVGRSTVEILARLGLHRDGHFLRAAVVLFGKTFLPDYPQCELRMARFRGTTHEEFLDQRQLRGPAFKLLDEAELFCQRHFPMPAKIMPGQLRRVEKTLIPVDAMREILVNALIHRDYSIAGGAVSLAIYDDRVEVWSAGTFPQGITPEMLTRTHLSVQRNPLIAEVFHRAGLIEKWGRGTNRVIESCVESGLAAPTFEEITGGAVVTFRVAAGSTARRGKVESKVESKAESDLDLPTRVLVALAPGPLSKARIAAAIGKRRIDGQLHDTMRNLVASGLAALSVPDKVHSRLQEYRLTTTGRGRVTRIRRGHP